MSEKAVLLTGGTGKTGRRVAALLQESGTPVRVVSRSTPVPFDWEDAGTWDAALEGIHSAYLVVATLGTAEAAEAITEFVRRAASAGVRRAVLLSVPVDGGLDDQHVLAAESALEGSGLEWTVLRVRWFFQNFSEDFLLDPVLRGELRLPAGDGREGFIDAQDIAAVAATVLTSDGHNGKRYELTGPRLMNFAEATSEIAAATGRDISYVPLTADEFVAEQRAAGVPDEFVGVLMGAYEQVRAGKLATLSEDVSAVLGRGPRDFSDYVKSSAVQGIWNI